MCVQGIDWWIGSQVGVDPEYWQGDMVISENLKGILGVRGDDDQSIENKMYSDKRHGHVFESAGDLGITKQ